MRSIDRIERKANLTYPVFRSLLLNQLRSVTAKNPSLIKVKLFHNFTAGRRLLANVSVEERKHLSITCNFQGC